MLGGVQSSSIVRVNLLDRRFRVILWLERVSRRWVARGKPRGYPFTYRESINLGPSPLSPDGATADGAEEPT